MLDNIPSIKELNFVGRESELEKVKEELANHDMVIICGTLGIGKTSLAEKYAYDLKEKGQWVRWIEAESTKIVDEYAQWAKDLEFGTGGKTIEEVRDSIYRYLCGQRELVYLILNNVDSCLGPPVQYPHYYNR